jgi:hypothetical protein
MLLGPATMAQTQKSAPLVSVRYYLCLSDEYLIAAISNSLHRGLVKQTLALPQFAGSMQNVLEVFFDKSKKYELLDARGSVYWFDAEGRLDLHRTADWIGHVVDAGRALSKQKSNVLEIKPFIRKRQWVAENTWKPSAKLLQEVRQSLLSGSRKLPSLKGISAPS